MPRQPRLSRSETLWEMNNPAETGVFRCMSTMHNRERCQFAAQEGVSCDKHAGEEARMLSTVGTRKHQSARRGGPWQSRSGSPQSHERPRP